MVMLHQLIGFC